MSSLHDRPDFSDHLPFIHFEIDHLHDALCIVADAARGLHALAELCRHYQPDPADDPFDPRALAGLIDPLYRRIATALTAQSSTSME